MTAIRSVLVVGGSGQVGGAFLAEASRRGIAATGTFHSHARPGLVPWDGTLEAFDALVARVQPGLVVYAAGVAHVDRCETESAECERWNAQVPGALARRCAGAPGFVYFSTDYVFDGAGGPYGEEEPVGPISAYARSKLAGERAVLDADPTTLVIRTTVVYGPEPQGKNFVAQLRARLGRGERMRVPQDQVSTPTYNVDLAARTLQLALGGASGVWHVAGPDLLDRYAFARLAVAAFGLDASLLDPVPTASLGQAAPRPLKGGLRTGKLAAALGADLMRGVQGGLAAYALVERGIPW
ncbi:MAG: SDR family oxidoreductase [Candidatus Rokuibacteriota bacterium]